MRKNNNGPFLSLPYPLIERIQKLPLAARWLYLTLLRDVKLSRLRIPYNNNHIINMSLMEMAKKSNLAKSAVQTALQCLIDNKFIKVFDSIEGMSKTQDKRTKFYKLMVF